MAGLPTVKFKYGSCDIICMDWTMWISNPARTSEFYFSKIFTNASGVRTTSLSMVTWFVCLILEREIDHSPPSVKNGWRYTSALFVRLMTSAETLHFKLLYIKISVHNFSRKTCRNKHFGDQDVDGIGSEMSDCGLISNGLRLSPYDGFCNRGNFRVSRSEDDFLDQLSSYHLHGQDSLP